MLLVVLASPTAKQLTCLLASCVQSFRVGRYQNYLIYRKTLQIKVVENYISYTKLNESTYLSPPEVEQRVPNIAMFQKLNVLRTRGIWLAYY